MLQRAASNAYTWWWASHIRTNESKWLDTNLEEMEARIKSMLMLIEEDADTFAKKAEMYYQRRPELIDFIQETYKCYKALAERYDHLSGELHKANNTLATVFPDQVHFGIEDDGEDAFPTTSKKHPIKYTKAASLPADVILPLKNDIKPSSNVKPQKQSSTDLKLYKDNAHEEIDKLQKGILALQTEKEFIKSSYETGMGKYFELEKRISEMQEKVCRLTNGDNSDTVIEDDEARAVMAVTALKSCEDTLVNLHEQRTKTSAEAKTESKRIKNVRKKLRALKCQYNHTSPENQDVDDSTGEISNDESLAEEPCDLSHERLELQSVCEKVKKNFKKNSEVSILDLAEKIDGLVGKVVQLESTVSSQTAQIQRLRQETDDLQKQVHNLEKEKMSLIDDSKDLTEKLIVAEKELQRIQELDRCVQDEDDKIKKNFKEAFHTFNNLSDKLQSPRWNDDNNSLMVQDEHIIKVCNEERTQPEVATGDMSVNNNTDSGATKIGTLDGEEHRTIGNALTDVMIKNTGEHLSEKECSKPELENLMKNGDSTIDSQRKSTETDSSIANWQQLFLIDKMEGREKFLLAEYSSILRMYKEAKKKLTDSEKRSQDQLFDTMSQVRDLKNTIVMKDEEIRSLRQKLKFVEASWNEKSESHLPTETKATQLRRLASYLSESSRVPYTELRKQPKLTISTILAGDNNHTDNEKSHQIYDNQDPSPVEEKFRKEIDELLEENLEFWLRFSASYQQIQNYRISVQDLLDKASNLREKKKQDGGSSTSSGSLKSQAASLYKQMKELHTDLSVWIEQNALLKNELQSRFSSLCNIRDEISRISEEGVKDDAVSLTAYQAAKFQGEVVNMQQENNKVADELQLGLDHVKGFQDDVQKSIVRLNNVFDLSSSSSKSNQHFRTLSSKTRIPLKAFLFGVKAKKPSIFSCMNPALQKQYSNIHGIPRPR